MSSTISKPLRTVNRKIAVMDFNQLDQKFVPVHFASHHSLASISTYADPHSLERVMVFSIPLTITLWVP